MSPRIRRNLFITSSKNEVAIVSPRQSAVRSSDGSNILYLVKLMIVDEHIGIQGNGNQDTQSWYHSQEVNVMLDSYDVCAAWADGIRRNQNTHLYGAVSREDGCWRDAKGEMAEGAIGIDPGRFSWAKGIVGAVQRVRGAGGF